MIASAKNPFLWIFAIVSSVNVRQWFGSNRKHANYVNGTIAVAITQTLVFYDIILLVSNMMNVRYELSVAQIIFLYILLLIANYWWMVMRGAGPRFIAQFGAESRGRQWSVRVTASAVVCFAVLAFFAAN